MNLRTQAIAFQTIVYKEVRRFLRIWMQTLLPPAITMTLYFIVFGSLIGERIGSMGPENTPYMEFVIPGLIMLSVITNSYANVVSSFYGAKFQNNVEELLISPVTHGVILAGYLVGGVVRGLLVGIIVTLVSLLFARLHVENIGVTVLVIFLTSVLFAAMGFINAMFANSFDDISIVPTFVLTPLIYLGGVFYSIDMLNDFWQTVSQLNPMLYVVNVFRYGILGFSDVNVNQALFAIFIFTLLTIGYCLFLLKRGKGLTQ